MFLLCALIAGSTSVWADDVLSWTARTSSSGDDTYTSGFTYATNKISGKSGYVQDSGTKDETIVSIALYKTDAKLFATTPAMVSFKAKLGGGSAKDPLDYPVYACFVDNTGADIAGSEVTVTTKITSTTGSDFEVEMPVAEAADAYGVKIYHMKENGWNVRYYNFTLSYSNQVNATWTLDPTTASVSAGESTVLDLTTNYDGTLTFTSNDTDIATVSYNSSTKKVTVNGISGGTTTISVTGDATANYNAINKTINVKVKKILAANSIMYESFDDNDEVGGNDGTWKNISLTPTPLFDLDGWTYDTAYGASRCVRIGSGGYFLSPALGVAGDVTLKFKTESWGSDGSNGLVDIVGGGTFDDSKTITGVTFQEENTRAQVTLQKKGTWTEYTLKINGVTASSKIKFFGPSGKRIFFDEVEVLLDKASIAPAKEYTTYVTPYALDFTSVDGLKAFVATEAESTGVTLEEPAAAVPAGTPLVLKKTGSDASYNVPVVASATAPATNLLKAGPADLTGDGTEYILSNGLFYQANAGTLAAGKAYLKVPAALARELVINWGETTGIGATLNDNVEMTNDNVIYDLSGRRVENPTKGIYIMNGKKVVIR